MKDFLRRPVSGKADSLDSLIPKSAELFSLGLECLKAASNQGYEIHFFEWARMVREARGDAKETSLPQLEWLWEAITSEPIINDSLGERIVSLEDEWKKIDPIACAPSGSRFGIFLKAFRQRGVPGQFLPHNAIPQAYAEIRGTLFMKPGKVRHLECKDVPTKLELVLEDIGSIETEAQALKLSPGDINITEKHLVAFLESLNHAYTKASLRLEPKRRSHGGRAYEHIALEQEGGGWKTLEDLRLEHEQKIWKRLLGEEEIVSREDTGLI